MNPGREGNGIITRAISIRTKLILGAGLIAALTVLTAVATAYQARETSHQISRIEEAQARIEHLAKISTQISDYAITAVDSATEDFSADRANERLMAKADTVLAVFERSQQAILQAQEQGTTLVPQTHRLLARLSQMAALFRSMDKSIRDGLSHGSASDLSASLNMFSTQFSPLLSGAINAEQTKRQDAVIRIGEIRHALSTLSIAVIVLTVLLLVAFNLRIIGPMVSRIGRIGEATKSIASGDFRINLPTEPADELGALFGQTNLMAEELRHTKARVEQDRHQLNEIIEARTLELTEANQRLSQIDTQRRRFFADVSHELRTPLTVILAEAELSQGASRDDTEESLKVILTRARKLNQRIDDLLRVARSESGRIELDLRETDLGKIAAEAAEDMIPHLRKKNIKLVTNIETAGRVIADADWIRQVICGLIENAIKHTPEHSQINLTVFEQDKDAAIEIKDQGNGLDPDVAQSAFERFRKGPPEVAKEGFGIGLALARWVTEEHGGTIELFDDADNGADNGKGLKVVILLPLVPN